MADEAMEATVGEIASLERNSLVGGPFGSNLISSDYVSSGVPVIRGQNMGQRWIGGEFAFVTPEKADSLSANLARPGDIVFTQRGTLGQVALVPVTPFERYLISQSQMKLTVDRTKADPLFIYYVFLSDEQQNYMQRNAIQTGVPHTNLGILRNTPIPLPSLSEQRAITQILGTLDDKIELNRRMNETLEAMARTLFNSWFVDFDPVRAKAEGRDPGLPKHLADLFPDRFEDSELGEIPAGWEVKELSEVTAQITKGTTPTQDDGNRLRASDGQINYLRVNAIADDGSISYDKLTKIPESIHTGVLKRSVLQTNDLVYTIAGTIGRVAVIEDDLLPANTNQAVSILRPTPGKIPTGLLFLTMRNQAFQEELHSNIVHAVQANLSLGMISKAKTVFPPEDALIKIFNPIEVILKKLNANRRESRILATLRDALLPKLISGELPVDGRTEARSITCETDKGRT